VVKNPPSTAGDIREAGLIPGSGGFPEGWHGDALQHSCLENLHGQRSLAGYSPWGCKESDTTEVTSCTHQTTKTFHISNKTLWFLIICVFTKQDFLFASRTFHLHARFHLTVWCKRPSFQPVSAFDMLSSLSLIISRF